MHTLGSSKWGKPKEAGKIKMTAIKKKTNFLMVKFLPLPYNDSTPSSDCKPVRGNSYHHSNSVATDSWFSRSESEVKSVSQSVL